MNGVQLLTVKKSLKLELLTHFFIVRCSLKGLILKLDFVKWINRVKGRELINLIGLL